MDFWDWLFSCGFDVEFGACFKKGHMYMCERMGRDGEDWSFYSLIPGLCVRGFQEKREV